MSLQYRKSLLVKLVSYFSLLSALTVGIVAATAQFRAQQVLIEDIRDRLTLATSLKSAQLDDWKKNQVRDVLLAGQQPYLRETVAILLTTDPESSAYREAYATLRSRVADWTAAKPNMQDIRITTNGGFVIFAANTPELVDKFRPLGSPTTYFTPEAAETVVPHFYLSKTTGKAAMTLATPIFDEAGVKMAALTVDLQLADIDALIRNNAGLGQTGVTYLVGENGTDSIFIFGKDNPSQTLDQNATSLGIERAISRHNGFALYRNHAGVPVVGIYRWLPDQNLALLAEISQVEAFAPARKLAGDIIGIGLVSIGVLLVGVYLLSRNIVRPIEAIGAAAQQFAAGDLDRTAPVMTEDEVGLLARTFNQMASQLKTSFEELESRVRERTAELETALTQLKNTQAQMIHSEKMSSLGQLVAGIAHEINNPVSFIHGNLTHTQTYVKDLLDFAKLYEEYYPQPAASIQKHAQTIDWEFLQQDLPKMLVSMQTGTERIREIVRSLRNFSRMDESEIKVVDIHDGIESTLMILQHRLQTRSEHFTIAICKDYGELPPVECCPGALNQVFMNILGNAIDALEEKAAKLKLENQKFLSGRIEIRTMLMREKWVQIAIADNGSGIPEEIQPHIFEPFFTTKAIGKGTGMGMSISYRIITEKHQGKIECFSSPDKGTEFLIEIPQTIISKQL